MPAQRAVTRSMLLAAPPDRIWPLIATPGGLLRWLGVSGADVPQKVLDIERGRRVRWLWVPDSEGPATTVEIKLDRDGEGTRLTVTEAEVDENLAATPA